MNQIEHNHSKTKIDLHNHSSKKGGKYLIVTTTVVIFCHYTEALNIWKIFVQVHEFFGSPGRCPPFYPGRCPPFYQQNEILVSTKLIFRALPKHCFALILAKFSAPQFLGTVFGHSQKSRFWALFEKFWQKNSVFFCARSPSKLVYIGAKGAFRKILGSAGQKWISEKVSKGGPFGSAGGRIPEGEGGGGSSAPRPSPLKSAPGFKDELRVYFLLILYFSER